MLKLTPAKAKNSFGAALLWIGIAKLELGAEGSAGAKENCEPSTPSRRKKRYLDQYFPVQARNYIDWVKEKKI